MTSAHIYFSGNVQGVGFRYTTLSYARDLHLKGWVRNLPDGRVEISAQGPKEDIEQLCGGLEKQFDGYIREKNIDFSSTQTNVQEFRII